MAEFTIALVKSGAFQRGQAPNILGRATSHGLVIKKLWSGYPPSSYPSRDIFAEFYGEHQDRPYFQNLLDSVSHGIAMAIFEGDNAVAKWRVILGPTSPAVAPIGSIRGDFGNRYVLSDNAAHGSDSSVSAEREFAILSPWLE